jgi:hypothetical protein
MLASKLYRIQFSRGASSRQKSTLVSNFSSGMVVAPDNRVRLAGPRHKSQTDISATRAAK